MINFTICNQVLEAHKLKKITKKEKKIKPESRNRAKIAKAIMKIKETSNKLIIDLSLQSVNIRLEKYIIVESDNKDLAFLANLPTSIPKDQGSNSFTCFFAIVHLNLCQPFLFIKISKKNVFESKIKDTAYSASFSNLWSEDTGLGIFLSQFYCFFPILNSTSKVLTLTIVPALLLKPEILELNFSIKYKALSQPKATTLDYLPHHKVAQSISLPNIKLLDQIFYYSKNKLSLIFYYSKSILSLTGYLSMR